MEFLEVNLRVSPRLKQPGVFPLTPVHTQLPAIHQNYHDVFLPPVYDSSRSAPACRALRISLENVQKENTGSFVRTKWNDLCKALSPIHQSREKIQQTFMNLSTSLVEFRLFSRSVLKICGSQTVCHRELIGMPSYVFSFQGTHGDIGHLTTITIKIFGL
uniref:uncharacterized protein LOC118531724 isoform X6 n=1 Tax=Halichoerus grypus TaxID=9711 RepID=UPI0016599E86|nr:uncharacterized protein LOC118531724 isoform X6 [Halichoerus grypus]XP_035941789.1 uncharacterized protein LOC118531724 isoform X6 [Halichoerus grypus]